jgi:glycosyltransferase involved in cell wall biosynthesis
MKIVSIILPVHNGEKYLVQTIESILGQTYKNFELVIVNDRSTDNSLNIINGFCQKDTRVKLFHNETGGRLPGTLNVGFAKANGDYYTWWSDDNIMNYNMLEKMVDILDNNPEYGCITANYTNIDCNDKIINDKILDTEKSILVSNNFCLSFLYRKEVAEKTGFYNTELFLVEDYDYFIRMSLVTKRYHTPEILGLYRVHDESLSSKRYIEVRQKDAELKYHYLEQFKPTLSQDDYFQILVKIYQYHSDIRVRNSVSAKNIL